MKEWWKKRNDVQQQLYIVAMENDRVQCRSRRNINYEIYDFAS